MGKSTLKRMLGYGLLAGALLVCLKLVSLAPLTMDWGRELIGAVIALGALLVGVAISRGGLLRERPASSADRPRHPLPADPGPAAEATPALSGREREVLGQLCAGLSNKQIARQLSLSENTVKTHLASLYGKLGVQRRTEAMAAAHRLGLVDLDKVE